MWRTKKRFKAYKWLKMQMLHKSPLTALKAIYG
nr:MAG TPA: hypothetical protein [Caudoviricetes sp.]